MKLNIMKTHILRITVIVAMTAVAITFVSAVNAQEHFLGEIIMVAFDYCPRGFAEANGQIIQINQYEALFALLGTTYGGDGRTSFALPDLRGRAPVHIGQAPGLDNIQMGQKGGTERATLNVGQLPSHYHDASTAVSVSTILRGTNSLADANTPDGNVLASGKMKKDIYGTGMTDVDMGASSVASTATATTVIGDAGDDQPVEIRSPFLGIRYCIALIGIFPSQN